MNKKTGAVVLTAPYYMVGIVNLFCSGRYTSYSR
jgi:hypothetical protein